MPAWLLRPGRPLALLEAVAFWPLWMLLSAIWLLPFGSGSWGPGLLVGTGVVFLSVVCLGSHVAVGEASVVAVGRRDPVFWVASSILLLMVTGALRFRYGALGLAVIVLGGASGLVSGLWTLLIAARAHGWASGRLRVTPSGVHLECKHASYALEAIPPGAAEGDPLTLPKVHVEGRASGPYRSGRRVGHAPIALRVDGDGLTRSLRRRGLWLSLWGGASVAHALVSVT